MKRFWALLLTLVLLLTSLATVASAAESEGMHWEWDEKAQESKCYYIKKDGTRVKGWYEVVGTQTYEYEDGSTETYDYDYWIYGEDNGYLAQGWKQIGGTWYYLWPEMVTGSSMIDGTAYLFKKNGAWTGVSSKQKGWFQKDGAWYYTVEEKYSWTDDEGKEHPETWLYIANNGTETIDNVQYAFDSDGKMLCNGWAQPWIANDDKDWVYATSSGALLTGWQKIDGTWYYFGKYGWMYRDCLYWDWNKDGTKVNAVYAFDASGAMISNKWYEEKWEWTDENGKKHTGSAWVYLSESGAAKTGWFQQGGKWYYADEYGYLCMDAWISDDAGNWYYLDESGAMVTGWYKYSNGNWLYFKDSGAKVESDWVKDGNSWYYMDENGNMVSNTTLTIKGVEYRFGADGAWIP